MWIKRRAWTLGPQAGMMTMGNKQAATNHAPPYLHRTASSMGTLSPEISTSAVLLHLVSSASGEFCSFGNP